MSARINGASKKRVLFVCTHNEVRSLTAEQVYRGRDDIETRSAGTASHARNPLTKDVVDWADLVVVFEPKHAETIKKQFPEEEGRTDLICLKLSDKYEYKNPKLMIKLASRLKPYLGEPAQKHASTSRVEGSLFRRMVQGWLF
jgi:predicted protein tyrosine phosphatase